MRTIKFRIWDKFHKRIYYLASSPMSQIHLQVNNEHWGLFDGIKFICGSSDNSGILMQFTGLTDKNGKEIYEGDIVNFLVETFTGNSVEYDERIEEVYYDVELSIMQPLVMSNEFKIIGNIHENPELLNN